MKKYAKSFAIFLVMYSAARVVEEVVENLTGGEDNFNRLADKIVSPSTGGGAA